MLELVGLASDVDAATAAANRIGGRLYVNHADEHPKRPYSALVRGTTDDRTVFDDMADIGLYLSYARPVKPEQASAPPGRAVASFGMVGHPDLTHRQVDTHWRDTHGPLALRSHTAMCDYTQLSFLATLSGIELDGMALCAFATREDLSKRFFNDDAAKQAVAEDVATFSDLHNSLRRVVLVEP